MAKNEIKLTTTPFQEYIEKLDKLGANLQEILTDALEQAAETIQYDTEDAVTKSGLPAKGKYSKGDTEKSIIRDAKVKWSGSIAEIDVGFNYNKPGAGGFLISGTPKMKPVTQLNRMYRGKKYMKQIQQDMIDIFQDEIEQRMGE